MKLYNEIINDWKKILEPYAPLSFPVSEEEQWQDIGKKNLVLPSDMAFEMGGSTKVLPAIGSTVITSSTDAVNKDEILVFGKDICEIKKDTPYARLTICLVDADEMGEGSELFNTVRAIEYTRYHVNPDGFMIRASSAQKRESARVSKDAIKKGISFENVGSLMIKSFKKNPKIKAVKMIFINQEDFPYEILAETVKKSEMITKAIDHISQTALMECGSCGLQKVCDEVEGMRELHFKNKEK